MQALLSTRKGLFELSRSQNDWRVAQTHFVGDPVTMSLHDARDGATYAALNLGHFGVKLHRRDAGGDTWKEIGVPTYPPQPEGLQDEAEWKLKQIWSMACGGADQPGVLWAGTLPGGLFRSSDRGDTWELVHSLWDHPSRREWMGGGYDTPGVHSICVDPRNSGHVLVAISSGGVWVTKDGGANWTASTKGMRATYMPEERAEDPVVQDPHRVVQSTAAPDVLWCQHHCGIWHSTDGGAQWEQCHPAAKGTSDFGFAVATHPRRPDTAWFVPAAADQKRIPVDTALSVMRTRDGGKTFESLRHGLPQDQCYDLIYRHGLAVADDGETLMMASTTGSLWASANGGEDWQLVSANLPPVYALEII
jgi:hypothetical protein